MKTIEVEILRRGPPHNQLLSPLTDYLVRVDEHPACTVHVRSEHEALFQSLSSLRYDRQAPMRADVAMDLLSRLVSNFLADIPALSGALGRASAESVELRLLTGAHEIALLPFELARSPEGYPLPGAPLFLQGDRPVFLTREVRRGSPAPLEWPKRPRILFAFSNAGGTVPFRAHLHALQRCLRPWLGWHSSEPDNRELLERMTILPDATPDDIKAACNKEYYTHVHILAHGAQIPGTERYGLALGRPDAPRVVDGDLLRRFLRNPNRGVPTVVSLAACDGGNTGGVISPHASVAHALHEEGVALVVASQFPLSVEGSVHFVQTFYQQLLEGTDPREALYAVRQELLRVQHHSHDWAALVAYAHFPRDFDKKVRDGKIKRMKMAGDVALRRAWDPQPDGRTTGAPLPALYADSLHRSWEGLNALGGTEAWAWLASAAMRWGLDGCTEVGSWRQRRGEGGGSLEAMGTEEALLCAARYYRRAFEEDPKNIFMLIGELFARCILDYNEKNPTRKDGDLTEDLKMARRLVARRPSSGTAGKENVVAEMLLDVLDKERPLRDAWVRLEQLWTDVYSDHRRGYSAFSVWRTLYRLGPFPFVAQAGGSRPVASGPPPEYNPNETDPRDKARYLARWMTDRGVPDRWDEADEA